ncbi:kinase-like domain-containing protein [Endogone sp. FLAS-F59071]|nr:kinase-like domain-containing protein [Endogone sp. FLAS-F59071]|eukprot:RUS15516.1 kinase-like domain-containing protein [Endogone sp. FLAS-F59071]
MAHCSLLISIIYSETGGSGADSSTSTSQGSIYDRCRMALADLGPTVSIYSIKDCIIGQPIGSGASMQVFEGTCIIAGTVTKVAFKRPHIVMDEKMRKKNFVRLTSVIKRELTIMEQLKSSSNIVNIYGLAFAGLTPVLIVELAQYSLDHYLSSAYQRGCPISWTEKIQLCCDICEGLLALHGAGVVHGDIKASNVLVFIKDDGTSTAKISDFGFSSTFLSEGDSGGGTLAFAAPECTRLGLAKYPGLLRWHRDKLQDVYSYGLTLWQIAMDGAVPFNGLSHSDIEIAKAEDSELNRLRSRLPSDMPPVLRYSIEVTTKHY